MESDNPETASPHKGSAGRLRGSGNVQRLIALGQDHSTTQELSGLYLCCCWYKDCRRIYPNNVLDVHQNMDPASHPLHGDRQNAPQPVTNQFTNHCTGNSTSKDHLFLRCRTPISTITNASRIFNFLTITCILVLISWKQRC
ncbi:hypothetical protein CJ030_MR0G007160 [Morella rubra]|uniref:Uncharacterized protein n=1 Tax=Morella rubra TaxID=262757 RepID=A0A6A1UMS9_9ROSI|nr:hypothetical protein CJ030_MR0G007160 [Morella rubra]